MVDINFWAVLVAAVANMIVGSFWYSPAGFGKPWMALVGLTPEKLAAAKQKGMAKTYIVAFISSLVMAFVLAYFVGVFGTIGVSGALSLAFLIWLGFVATIMLGIVLWEGRPVKLYLINASYWLVSLLVMSLILVFLG